MRLECPRHASARRRPAAPAVFAALLVGVYHTAAGALARQRRARRVPVDARQRADAERVADAIAQLVRSRRRSLLIARGDRRRRASSARSPRRAARRDRCCWRLGGRPRSCSSRRSPRPRFDGTSSARPHRRPGDRRAGVPERPRDGGDVDRARRADRRAARAGGRSSPRAARCSRSAVGFAIVALGWHFPSDVVGGYLVATRWCARRRWPRLRRGRRALARARARSARPRRTRARRARGVAAGGRARGGVGGRHRPRARSTASPASPTRTRPRPLAAVGISWRGDALVAAVSLVDQRRPLNARERAGGCMLARVKRSVVREVRCESGAVPPL